MQKLVKHLSANKYLELTFVAIISFVIACIYMGQSFSNFNTTVLGKAGDHTSGIIYANFTHTQKPWPGYTSLANYPFGENMRIPISATTQIPSLIHWTFSKVVNPVAAWNLLVLLGYVVNALITYLFIRWLTKNRGVALFGAYALSFTPYHAFSSTGQIAGMFSGLFVLALWRFLILWREPSLRNATILGLLFGFSYYTDGYFILLSFVMILSLWLSVISYYLVINRGSYVRVKNQLLSFLQSSIIAFVCLLPLLWVNKKYASEISDILGNARNNILVEAQTYSAQLSHYVNPRSVLYIGAVVTMLALGYFVILALKLKKDTHFIGWLLVTFTLVSLLFSLQPKLKLGSIEVYSPSFLIISLTSVWRVFGRLYILVTIGAVTMAALALKQLTDRYRNYRIPIIIFAISMAIVDLGAASLRYRKPTFSYADVPYVYQWLGKNEHEAKSTRALAEYPLEGYGYQADYFTYVQVSHKPILNANLHNSPQKNLKQSILGINDPQTIPVLRALGIDLVNVRDITYKRSKLDIKIRDSVRSNPQLKMLFTEKNKGDGIDSYLILQGKTASYALTIPATTQLRTILKPQGSVDYVASGNVNLVPEILPNAKPRKVVTLSFDMLSSTLRNATIVQNGKLLWSGSISNNKQTIRINALSDKPVNIYTEEGVPLAETTLRNLQIID